jgi:succinate-semialdehyde dehydrogenase/glutarate-semialdehyde dehydrogenase
MFQSINPYSGSVLTSYDQHTDQQAESIIEEAHLTQKQWKLLPIEQRSDLVKALAENLKRNKSELARLITHEMGKVIGESVAEIGKCAWLCDYYAEHAAEMLEEQGMPSDGTVSYVVFQPLGVIYAIMPWNFPFWQVLRFAIPAILAGNTVVLKHAPNVFGCGLAIQKLFEESGFPKGVFSNLLINVEQSDRVIANELIQGVTLTGSQAAGRQVAAVAGKHLKKTVMELGGSDPFIILADADLEQACETATTSRMLNSGQVCIAAKRFIVEASVYDEFVNTHKSLMENLRSGDPFDPKSHIGPMARMDLVNNLDQQVKKSIAMGARLVTGGRKAGDNFYTPTLLADVKKGMPVFDEETFGPVSAVIRAEDAADTVRIANDTSFGLGASIWTSNLELAEAIAEQIEAGAVFINGLVKSDPRLPFGGIKQSGYGRELSVFGIREFANIKTIWIK